MKELVNNGFTIFSGLATGIDTIAHETTIFCGGQTAAVIGRPITKFYPMMYALTKGKVGIINMLAARKDLNINHVDKLGNNLENYAKKFDLEDPILLHIAYHKMIQEELQ